LQSGCPGRVPLGPLVYRRLFPHRKQPPTDTKEIGPRPAIAQSSIRSADAYRASHSLNTSRVDCRLTGRYYLVISGLPVIRSA